MWNDNLKVIEALLSGGADVGVTRVDGTTVLMGAAEFNRSPEVIRMLLEAGAGVNTEGADDWTPLMMAAADFHKSGLRTVRALLSEGAAVNAQNAYGLSALMIAARFSTDPRILEELLAAGAEADSEDRLGKTALDHARGNRDLRNTEVFERLKTETEASRGAS